MHQKQGKGPKSFYIQGDISRVRRLLDEGRVSVHETTEEGESLLSLACSAGYYELAQVIKQCIRILFKILWRGMDTGKNDEKLIFRKKKGKEKRNEVRSKML